MENSCFFIVIVTLSLLLKCTTLCSGRNFFNSSTDQDALLAFKATISRDSYAILANNWSTNSASVCYWIGVSCGIKHQRVTALNLSGFHLRGTVAPHLGSLTFLRSLDISFNNFTGILPDELSNLRRLKEINVGFNSFTGEVPFWFGTLPELQHIHLNNNTFTGKIPPSLFNTTSKLQTLNLQYNQFTAGSMPYGGIPTQLGNLTSLKYLWLGANKLTGGIPKQLGNLTSLNSIYLGVNNLTGGIPKQFGNLTSLNSLSLHNNKLTNLI
ncbi:hypothetical protein BUALT_Bualt08G0128800 [Buddleja alternifolia]|uniref:Leucine-rich repeat-containing N-terminal plant-type domain-containing protein n=1 Tax=Buddleja alternifolia TaxID=168488 RepID=A0AAV6X5D2_9LAMI|nr:hypothetical protein BUALT_Bualt08G0128800 [Buddleja alternifolia]